MLLPALQLHKLSYRAVVRQEGDLGGSVREGLLQPFKHKWVLETELFSVLHLICAYLKKRSASSLQIFMQWSGGGFTGGLMVVGSS